MADLFIDVKTNDLIVDPNTKELKLTQNVEQLTRQRLSIRLKTFKGEWYKDSNLGLPYFQEIFGKRRKVAADLAIKNLIVSTKGILEILAYNSEIDTEKRKLNVSFKCKTLTGDVIQLEETV